MKRFYVMVLATVILSILGITACNPNKRKVQILPRPAGTGTAQGNNPDGTAFSPGGGSGGGAGNNGNGGNGGNGSNAPSGTSTVTATGTQTATSTGTSSGTGTTPGEALDVQINDGGQCIKFDNQTLNCEVKKQ